MLVPVRGRALRVAAMGDTDDCDDQMETLTARHKHEKKELQGTSHRGYGVLSDIK